MEDERFKASIIKNLIIAVPAIVLEFFLGFGYALLLNKNLPGRGIIIGLLVAPVLVAPVMVGMSWRMLYGAKYGALNNLFRITGLITENFDWFADGARMPTVQLRGSPKISTDESLAAAQYDVRG